MRSTNLIAALGLLGQSIAILVADDSPCGTVCGNVLDATTGDDIVCSENSYTSGTGALFDQCLSCELTSTYSTSDNETDAEALLYNLRYAVSYCLFGVPAHDDTINTPCLTSRACEPYQNAILYKNLSSSVGGYDYCGEWPGGDDDLSACTTCLQSGDEYFIANFITVLEAGCEQKPAPGVTLSIEGSIFSDDVVNVTSPTPTASVNPDWFDHGPVSLGGKVGIAFGGFAFILFLLGFFIIWNGRRRRRAFLSKLQNNKPNNPWPAPLNTSHPDMHHNQTPMSQRPLRGWDDSPQSVQSEQFPKYVSPFASQYSSPVSATELRLANWPAMVPHGQNQMLQPQDSPHIGVAYGGDQASIHTANSGQSKEKQESYEMQPVESSHRAIGVYGHSVSSHSLHQQQQLQQLQQMQQLQQLQQLQIQQEQGYFEGQYHPGQMFPNMYQQEQHLHPSHPEYEGDVKK